MSKTRVSIGCSMIERYRAGAVLRKYDGGFFKLLRYKNCGNVRCDSLLECGGYALEVRRLFHGDGDRQTFCPIHTSKCTPTFEEVNILHKEPKRIVTLGEGWDIEEVQNNQKRNGRSRL